MNQLWRNYVDRGYIAIYTFRQKGLSSHDSKYMRFWCHPFDLLVLIMQWDSEVRAPNRTHRSRMKKRLAALATLTLSQTNNVPWDSNCRFSSCSIAASSWVALSTYRLVEYWNVAWKEAKNKRVYKLSKKLGWFIDFVFNQNGAQSSFDEASIQPLLSQLTSRPVSGIEWRTMILWWSIKRATSQPPNQSPSFRNRVFSLSTLGWNKQGVLDGWLCETCFASQLWLALSRTRWPVTCLLILHF